MNSVNVFLLCSSNSLKFSNSLKLSILLDMKPEKMLTIGSNCLKVWRLFYFFGQMFYYILYALCFHACIFFPLGWLWLKNNFGYIWFSWSFSSKWCQSKWTKGTHPLSCPALFNLKSEKEEVCSTWNQAGKSCILLIYFYLLL